ncbi:MAG TPA: TldD/PmbA family protein [Candidatus Norongarragalinales archaeon]|jgi:TldD protein|nr:TldD/PmbA family protein [Candidatus Norongarragalinales archaeon]
MPATRPDADLAHYAINTAQKMGAKYAEARLEHAWGQDVLLKDGVPEAAGFEEQSGIGVRFIINGTLGFATTNILKRDAIKQVIQHAANSAKKASARPENVELSDEKAVRAKWSAQRLRRIEEADPSVLMRRLLDLDKAVYGEPVLHRFFSLGVEDVHKVFVNSDGSEISTHTPRVDFHGVITVHQGAKTAQQNRQYGAVAGLEVLEEWPLERRFAKDARFLEKALKEGVNPPHGPLDVIVGPDITGIMTHESVGHPLEADRILGREAAQAGESWVKKDSIGTKYGSKHVTIVDDPTIAKSYGNYAFDDEGVPARKRVLIEKGYLNSFLHNRETAGALRTHSNASARASRYDVEPLVRMANTIVMPGDYEEEELFEGVRRGVFIKHYMEWNIDDVRMNQKYVGSEAYLIENGRMTKPCLRPSLEITTPALWNSVDAVAKHVHVTAGSCGKGEPMQGMPVHMGGPEMRLRRVRVGKG